MFISRCGSPQPVVAAAWKGAEGGGGLLHTAAIAVQVPAGRPWPCPPEADSTAALGHSRSPALRWACPQSLEGNFVAAAKMMRKTLSSVWTIRRMLYSAVPVLFVYGAMLCWAGSDPVYEELLDLYACSMVAFSGYQHGRLCICACCAASTVQDTNWCWQVPLHMGLHSI